MTNTRDADEPYTGPKEKNEHANSRLRRGRGPVGKEVAFPQIERQGRIRSFHVPSVNTKTLRPILQEQIDKGSYLMTDESKFYPPVSVGFSDHGAINQLIGEYVRSGFWHSNPATP